jgi:protease-4
MLILVGSLYEGALGLILDTGEDGRAGGPQLEEVVVEDNRSDDKIVVLTIDGIIMKMDRGANNLVEVVREQLKRAEKDKQVKAVLLKVDSPGGEVLASDDIARAVAKFQKDSRKPVIAAMESLAASGGYYVSAPCQWIVANELTITGSIGVILQSFNYRGLMDKIGLHPQTFKSGKHKDMLSGAKELSSITPEERDMVQRLVNETFEKFKSVVAEGRRQANEKNRAAGDPGRALDAKWVSWGASRRRWRGRASWPGSRRRTWSSTSQ